MSVWIYVDTSKQVGDPDHLNKVFASQDAAEASFVENDPEGVAFDAGADYLDDDRAKG